MCEPVALTFAGISLAGAGMQAYASHRAGEAGVAQAEAQAQISEWQQQDVLRKGAFDASVARQRGRAAEASALTGLAAGNIETTTGSSAGLLARVGLAGELDADTIKGNAALAAWGLKTEAEVGMANAKNGLAAGNLNAVGAILGGVGQAGAIYKVWG